MKIAALQDLRKACFLFALSTLMVPIYVLACSCPPYCCQNCVSPIIIDTIGEGFRLTSAEDGVRFDFEGNNVLIPAAWTAIGSGNAFLALDRNHNGRIDSGKELFGNFTDQPPCPEGQPACKNGYRALAEFDKPSNGGNGDGIIDNQDAIFKHLLLWIDLNHDGVSQPNELYSLPDLGVYSISLDYHQEHFQDQYGNWFRFKGRINVHGQDRHDRVDRTIYDVFFKLLTPQDQ